MPLYFFYTMARISQTWPKTPINGGSLSQMYGWHGDKAASVVRSAPRISPFPFDFIKAGATQTETSLLKQSVAGERVDLLDDLPYIIVLAGQPGVAWAFALRAEAKFVASLP